MQACGVDAAWLILPVEWQQSEAVKLFADAFGEAKCSYDSERASAPGCVSKCLKVGDGVFRENILLNLGGNRKTIAFPTVHVSNSLQSFRTSADLVDFDL